jgi:non-specific serine/threonine protein kinase
VYFVPLAAVTDPVWVLPAIAKALGVREASGQALQEQLAQHLHKQQILLVLDNFEQVIDAAPVVGALLTAAPRLKVLVTSREVLRVSGEVNVPVPPLSLPDPGSQVPLERLTQYAAVALFIDRALAVNPAFAVTNDNAPALAEICHRLEGLPLAIELAAARARVLAPQRMLVELGNRLAFVTGTARDLTARQRTLRGAIDWSHELLTLDEQKLFRRLAVFVGGFTLEAIVPVCDVEGDLNLLNTIESLVAKSLVKPADVGQSRFAMLETIRDYAAERLQAAEETAVLRERQRNVFLALAREAIPHLSRANQGVWLDRLESEHDNMRAALDWSLAQANAGEGEALLLCGALARFWWTRGHLSEGRNWCARALASAGSEGPRVARAGALNGAGALAYYQGDFAAARTLYAEGLALYRELGDQKSIAILTNNLGNVAIEQGDYAHAQQLYEESLVVRREMGDKLGIATALSNLGNALAEQGDYATARARVQESLALDRETGDTSGIAISLNNLGDYACEQGDYPGAKTLYEEALVIKRELGDRVGIAITLTGLGNVLAEQGDFGGAQSLYAESLEMRRALGDRRGIAYSLEGLAAVQAAVDDASRAARIWGAAERLREELRAPLPANERPRYDRRVTAARAALGDDVGFDRAWAEGRGLTIEQAIALTLGARAERT